MGDLRQITYPSADGHTAIVASVWEPDGAPRGIVQICHGMAEHIGRYDWLARQLNAQGFLVCGDDHLGHGRTAKTKEELGYFGDKDGWRCLVEDEQALRARMQQEYPELPYFLLGHSMGSFITRLYITRYAQGLAGYICCGTSGRNPLAKLAIVIATLCCAFAGPRKRGYFLNKLAFKDYNSRYGEVVTGHEWLSRDQAVYLPFANDPKADFVFTNAGFRDLFRLLDRVTGMQWSRRVPPGLPILVMSGSMDPVGQFGKGAPQVAGWLREAGVRDVELKLYADARHELHNELNRDEVVADMTAFMARHM